MSFTSPFGLRFDKRSEGWKPVRGCDLPPLKGKLKIELTPFLKEREDSVRGTEMVARANKLGHCADQRHAERMLELSADIPAEFRPFILIFPATVWRHPRGRLGVPCLSWYGDAWDLYFRWLDNDFGSDHRLVRLRQPR